MGDVIYVNQGGNFYNRYGLEDQRIAGKNIEVKDGVWRTSGGVSSGWEEMLYSYWFQQHGRNFDIQTVSNSRATGRECKLLQKMW